MDTATFNVLEFLSGANYPTEEVVLYTDVKSAAEFERIKNERDNAQVGDAKTEKAYQARLDKLAEAIKASALTFHLQGLPPKESQAIVAESPSDADLSPEELDALQTQRGNELVARTITQITNNEGANGGTLTAEQVADLPNWIVGGEIGKLITAVSRVNFNAAVFDSATDAGFLGGPANEGA